MTKLVLPNVASGFNLQVINDNFQKIEDELQSKVLYRNNPVGEPNTLETNIDANGKRILNLPAPIADSEPARLADVKGAQVYADASAASAVQSASSATAAATSASQAAASYDSFDDRYLGSKDIEPTTDNDGSPLIKGAIYFDTYLGWRAWDGSAWITAIASNLGRVFNNPVIVATEGQTVFSVPSGYVAGMVWVIINGYKIPASDYSAVTGNTIVLNTPCKAGEEVEVVSFSHQDSSASSILVRTTVVATDNQKVFPLTYVPGMLLVSVRGQLLTPSDYSADNGTSVTLNAGIPTGTEVEFIVFSTIVLANTVPLSGGTMTGPLSVPAGATGTQVPQAQEVVSKTGDSVINGGLTTTGSLGYSTGAGGTVTQATSKTTAVTLNKPSGQIVTNNASLAANTVATFTCNNSVVGSADTVILTIYNSVASGNYNVWAGVANGAFVINLKNISGSPAAESVTINFVVIKGVIA